MTRLARCLVFSPRQNGQRFLHHGSAGSDCQVGIPVRNTHVWANSTTAIGESIQSMQADKRLNVSVLD